MENKENSAEAELEVAETPEMKYYGWKTMPYVIGNETFEKLGGIATASNLFVYLTTVFHIKSINAATTLNVFNGTTSLATVLGAFVSDSYLGRYKTLGFASIFTLAGMVVMTLTAAIQDLHPPSCEHGTPCTGPTKTQLSVLVVSFLFLVIGAGGIRPCNLAFGADQFNPNTDSGKKEICSFFNWYYFTFTIAVMISSTFIIYIQSNVSWTLGLAIPAIMMLISCIFFFLGTNIYVKVKPEGSPFTSIAQVLAAAVRKWHCKLSNNPNKSLFNPPHSSSLISKLPSTDQFRYLDKAAIMTSADEILSDGTAARRWRLCSVQQIEEVKCLLRIAPIWSTGILYYMGMAQQSSYVVLQAMQSDRHIGGSNFEIPAGSFSIFSLLALSIWLPLYDTVVIPWLRRATKKEQGLTVLQRMGAGMLISILAMIVSGLVETKRRSSVSSLSSLWLVPQLMLSGLAEAFATIGQMQFYYKEFPEHMRSVAGCLFFCTVALSNYLSGFLVMLLHANGRWLAVDLNQGRLEKFYYLIAGMGAVNFGYFLVCSSWYKYKGSQDSISRSESV